MVEVRYKARLGNNLFQYCLGRIIAEELGFALRADPIPGFPNTGENIEGAIQEGPDQILSGQRIDLAGVLADRSPRRIVLDGWFQHASYYRPFRGRIRQWLAMDPAIRVPDIKPAVVVNVRRTDYVQVGWALPFSYYEEAIERLLPQGGDIWIVTDDAKDPFFWQFRRWRPNFFRGNSLEAMMFMNRAERLVMSQSTFSWWPAFLAESQEAVCPAPSFGCWATGAASIGIELIERDHFLCIECPKAYAPTWIEQRYQRWRHLKRSLVLRLNRYFHLRLAEPPP